MHNEKDKDSSATQMKWKIDIIYITWNDEDVSFTQLTWKIFSFYTNERNYTSIFSTTKMTKILPKDTLRNKLKYLNIHLKHRWKDELFDV